MTVNVPPAATPADPTTSARTGTVTDSDPVRTVRDSVVTTVTPGTSPVEIRVPCSMVISPGAGVERENTTSPDANNCVRRSSPTSATSWSRSRPSAVSRNAASYTCSS